MKAFRDIRVLPVVVVAVFGLAVLKVAGLMIDGGYVFDYAAVEPGRKAAREPLREARAAPRDAAWASNTFNFPGSKSAADDDDVTGSTPAPEPKPEVKAPETTAPPQQNAFSDPPPIPPAERAVLERLQARRQELEARAREIDIRESLLKTAEKRIEGKAEELKTAEKGAAGAGEQKSEAETAKFKGLVTMYESMKPKDAAKVFDRLEMPVLIEIATQIAPRKMADILGLMQAEAAERLTVEMARRAGGIKSASQNGELPKIEGRPIVPGSQQ